MTNTISHQILPESSGMQKLNEFFSVYLLVGIEAGSELSAFNEEN